MKKTTYQTPEVRMYAVQGEAFICQSVTISSILGIDDLSIEGFNDEAGDITFLDY